MFLLYLVADIALDSEFNQLLNAEVGKETMIKTKLIYLQLSLNFFQQTKVMNVTKS